MSRLNASLIALAFLLRASLSGAQVPRDTIPVNPFGATRFISTDYSKMGDTVIFVYGSLFGGIVVESQKGRPSFAKEKLVIRNGRIRRVHIIDTNTGCKITEIYGRKKLIYSRQHCKAIWATNDPHF